LSQLPDGQVTLVATSLDGAGLAAACAAMAADRVVSWQLVNPGWRYDIDGVVVAVAPSDPGEGWHKALCDRFSGIRFVFPQLGPPDTGIATSISSHLLPVPQQSPERAPRQRASEPPPHSF
jgi:pimeloyl-ACP methyl ester carboxylesterase